MDISIIFTIYNSSYEDIELTLNSIIKQIDINYEIIFADDCSPINQEDQIHKYMKKTNISYKYIRNAKNVGTVRNCLNALSFAKGRIVKPIGAGDIFIYNNLFSRIVNYNQKFDIIYVPMIGYIKQNGKYYSTKYRNPLFKNSYKSNNLNKCVENFLIYGDHFSGAGLFYKKDTFFKYLSFIKDKIIYVEDFITVFALLDYLKVVIDNQFGIYYSLGTGISTKMQKDPRILADANSFNDLCIKNYSQRREIIMYQHVLFLDGKNSIFSKVYKYIRYPKFISLLVKKKINYKMQKCIVHEIYF